MKTRVKKRWWRWLLAFSYCLFLIAISTQQEAQAHAAGQVAVVVELNDPPVAAVYARLATAQTVSAAALTAATRAQLAHVEQAQQVFLAALADLDAQVIYRNQRVYNGVALRLAAADLERVRQLPGVKAVHLLVPKTPDNSISIPWIGAPQLWSGLDQPGATGENIRIAIIDTGIDYLHTTFGGPGVGYAHNDPTRVGDVAGFPSAKIIGGYDFAGNAYNANPDHANFNPIPTPDADPMDCYAHGTAVAATAAGYGVTQDGATYDGAYDQHMDFAGFRIGPGVAPQSQIYALKVFGCTGSSEIVDMAIEWAVDPNGDGDFADRVDVINLSLGSPFGSLNDPTTRASENAAAVGVIVVASAGNSGDVTYATGAPAVASHAISVAASQIPLGASEEGDEGLTSFSARGPRAMDAALKPDLAAPGEAIFTAHHGSGNDGRTVSGTSLASPQVAGAMALLRQHYPQWPAADLKALVMNTALTQLRQNPSMSSPYFTPARIGAGRIDLGRAMAAQAIVYNADDPGLVSISFGAPEVLTTSRASKNVRIANKQNQAVTFAVTYASSTDLPGIAFSPTVTQITASAHGFADLALRMDVDASALRHLREASLDAFQAGKPRHWQSEESGYLLFWPPAGAFTATLASSGASPSMPKGMATFVYNPVSQALEYTLEFQPLTTTVTAVRIGESAPVRTGAITGKVVLNAVDVLRLRNGHLRMLVQTRTASENELSGVIAWPTAVLSLPVYVAPRPAASLQAAPATLYFDKALQSSQTFTLGGLALTGSQPPTDVVSLVSLSVLHTASPRLAVDSEFASYPAADLKYAGVASDFAAIGAMTPAGAVEASTIYFAIATHGNWSSPNEVEFNVRIDIDQDGNDDYVLFNTDQVSYNGGSGASDVFVTALRDLRTNRISVQMPLNGLTPVQLDMALYNSSVMLLPVRAGALGLTSNDADFSYFVESYSEEASVDLDGTRRAVDKTQRRYVAVDQPGLIFSATDQKNGEENGVTFQARDGMSVMVDFNLEAYFRTDGQGVLVLHHHNQSTQRGEVVAVEWAWPHVLYLPSIYDS